MSFCMDTRSPVDRLFSKRINSFIAFCPFHNPNNAITWKIVDNQSPNARANNPSRPYNTMPVITAHRNLFLPNIPQIANTPAKRKSSPKPITRMMDPAPELTSLTRAETKPSINWVAPNPIIKVTDPPVKKIMEFNMDMPATQKNQLVPPFI